jgi:hypothetical protein
VVRVRMLVAVLHSIADNPPHDLGAVADQIVRES